MTRHLDRSAAAGGCAIGGAEGKVRRRAELDSSPLCVSDFDDLVR